MSDKEQNNPSDHALEERPKVQEDNSSTQPEEAEQTTNVKQHTALANLGNGNSNNSSGTFAQETEQMKIFVTNSNVTYHTRHARRIYVGGIPPNYSDEDELRNFFCKVISKGLHIENDLSFVISVYMNQKKCYAFVEFNSIELTTACLEMDGIIFKKVTLKIYRANEYRPELVPPTKFLKLDLTGWSFGLATGAGGSTGGSGSNTNISAMSNQVMMNNNQGYNQRTGSFSMMSQNSSFHSNSDGPQSASPVSLQLNDCIAALIQFANMANTEPGAIAIVGFPFESNNNAFSNHPNSQRGVGVSTTPACFRKGLTSYPNAMIYNPEYGLDLSLQPMVDVGDVMVGPSKNETKVLLSSTVSEVLLRGCTPFVIGGSREQTYYSAMGLVAATGVSIGVLNISAQLDCRILDCPEFCSPSSPNMSSGHRGGQQQQRSNNCYGRYVQFGAQGAQCSIDTARSITDRGGHIYWLHKDLRSSSTESIAVAQFSRALRNLDACVLHDQQRKGVNPVALRNSFPQSFLMISLDCGVLAGEHLPLAGSSHCSVGLTTEEVLEMAYIAGTHPNVAMFELIEFRPDLESESRLNMLPTDIYYKFALGVASRTQTLAGGALGAGAVALSTSLGSTPTSTASVLSTGNPSAAYQRTPTASAAAGKRIGIPYVPPDNSSGNSKYMPSRDPAFILQQQQQQQQQQQMMTGRSMHHPLQQQQQMQLQQQMAASGRNSTGGIPIRTSSFEGFNINRSVQQQQQLQHQQQQRGYGNISQPNSSYFNIGPRDEDCLSVASLNNEIDLVGNLNTLKMSSAPLHQRGLYTDDSAPHSVVLGGAPLASPRLQGLANRPNPIITSSSSQLSMSSTGGVEGSYPTQPPQQQRPYSGSSLNPAAATFQSDNSGKWAGYAVNSASVATPSTGVGTFNNDWGQRDSRLSNLSCSTASLNLNNSSSGMPLSAGSQHNFSGLFSAPDSTTSSSSQRSTNLPDLSAAGFNSDAMDKLIGVTNIGHFPSFDDPSDPQYHDD